MQKRFAVVALAGALALTACTITITEIQPTPTATVPAPVVVVEMPPTSTPLPTQAPPTATPTITPTPEPARIEGAPLVDYPANIEGGDDSDSLPWFKFEIAQDNREPIIGETLTQTVTLVNTPALVWDSWWCAANDQILERTVNNMEFEYTLNGVALDPETQALVFDQFQSNGAYCRVTAFLLRDWPSGTHELRYSFTVLNNMSDGFRSYPPATYPTVYTIEVP